MKNFKSIAILFMLMFFTACSSDDNEPDDEVTALDIADIEAAVKSGTWHITYYFDSGNEETSDYIGFDFTFNEDGTLGATDGNTSVSGAWSITDSDSSDDIDFNIFFTSPAIFEELADDWEIEKYSTVKIELMDVSGGDGTIDYLTFEKI